MRDIVDFYYDLLRPESFKTCDSKTNDTVKNCEECFQTQYDYAQYSPSYDCDEKKKLYAVRFLFTHQSEVLYGLNQIDSTTLDAWFEQRKCQVLSIGGGPGTDIFAFVKYLAVNVWKKHIGIELKEVRMELENSWDSYFAELYTKTVGDLNLRYKGRGVKISGVVPETIYRNVNKGGMIEIDGSPCEFDLVCVSYLVSELSDISGLVEILKCALSNGSVLLITDIDNEEAKRRIRNVFDSLGMDPLVFVAPTFEKNGEVRPTWAGHIYGKYMPKLESENYSFQYSNRVKYGFDKEPKAYLKAVNFLGYKR